MKAKIEHPKVFISYAWGNNENQQRVIDFASSLMSCGIDVILDRWNLKEGNDKYAFMEKCVTDLSVTNVLLLLDKNYTDKANARIGGVGDETQIISAEVYGKVEQSKFLPIIFAKGENGEIYKPAYLQSALHVDLSDADTYDGNFQYLVKLLYGVEIYKKPDLGKKPIFVEEDISIPITSKIKFESIKKQKNIQIQKYDFASALQIICENISNYNTDDLQNAEDYYSAYLKKYNDTITIRDEFLELIKTSIFVEESEKQIASFFEETKNKCYLSNSRYPEIAQIFIQEIFTYTIAYFIKHNQYDKVNYLLGKTYFERNGQAASFQMFHAWNMHSLDEAKKAVDGQQYSTGTGKLWIENLNFDFCNQKDFVLADSICFNYSIFTSTISEDDYYWFPTIYIYGQLYDANYLKDFCIRLQSLEKCEEIIKLFGFKTVEEFKLRFSEVEKMCQAGNFSNYRYTNAFNSATVLCHHIKSSDIGKYR